MTQPKPEENVAPEVGAEEQEVPASPEDRLDALEGVVFELIGKVEEVVKEIAGVKKSTVQKAKGLFGGKREPSPMKDLKTGTVYPSKASLGKNLAVEANADPLSTMAYYVVIKNLKMPDGTDRFVEASPEEGAKALADKKAQIEKEVAEANKRLEKEAAEKAAAEAKAAKK